MNVVAPASRNAPCPCGSGRRYKECHGAVGAGARACADVPPPPVAQRMQVALDAQRAGRIAEAIAIYDEVLVAAPATTDAWHMRGVARFQQSDYDAAEADILRALELLPGLEAAKTNLALVRQGRRITREEAALCLAILPRFRPMAVDPPVAPLDGVAAGAPVWILDAAPEGSALPAAIEREARARGANVRRVVVASGRVVEEAAAQALARAAPAETIVGIGCTRPFGDWTLETRAGTVGLVASGDPIAAFEDRLGELSGQRRRRVRIALARDATLPLGAVPHWRSRTW